MRWFYCSATSKLPYKFLNEVFFEECDVKIYEMLKNEVFRMI